MASPANTVHHYALQNKIPDIHRMVSDISPWKTPVWNLCKHITSKQTNYKWTIFENRAASTGNNQEDGKTYAADAATEPYFAESFCQISDRNITVDNRAEKSNTTGVTKMSERTQKEMIALKYDVESILLSDQLGRQSADSTNARASSLSAYIRTNISLGASGSAPTVTSGTGTPAALATIGTARAFQKSQLDSVLLSIATNSAEMMDDHVALFHPRVKGGLDKILAVGGVSQTAASTYQNTGVAAQTQDHGRRPPKMGLTAQGAVQFYNSTYGQVELMMDQWSPSSNSAGIVHVLNPKLWCLVFFRKMHFENMGVRGDYKDRQLRVDWGTKSIDQRGSAAIRAINNSSAVTA